MTTREHREIHTQRVVQRSLSPQHTSQLDNNLDNLLEDLQNSVSRPNSSLAVNGSGIHGGNYREYSTSQRTVTSGSTLNRPGETRIEYRSAANPITVPSESTTIVEKEKSKDGTKEKTVYKTIKYEYDVSDSISPETSSRMQTNINQLDNLLDDLQQARKGTVSINTGIDPGLLEPVETSRNVTKKTVQRELVYGTEQGGKVIRSRQQSPTSIRRSDREGSVTRETAYTIDDGTYGDIRHTRQPSPQRIASNSSNSTIQKTTNVKNYSYNTNVPAGRTEIIDPAVLSDLDPSLLPNPNTKVTTTIKTYTYEIPGTPVNIPNSGYPSRVQSPSEHYVYNVSPSPTINRNETYETYNTTTRNINHNYPNERTIPRVSSPQPATNYQTTVYKEENRNYYGTTPPPPVTNYHTTVYKEDVRTTNKSGEFVPSSPKSNRPSSPYRSPSPVNRDYPPKHNTTTIHKTDTYNSTYGYNPNDPNATKPVGPPYSPGQNVNITYKYTTNQTVDNKYKGYGPYPGGNSPHDDRKPLLQPGRFPTDQNDHPNGGPPKKLDDLMASFGGSETTNVYNSTTTNSVHRYEDESKQKLLPGNAASPTPIADAQRKKDIKDLPKTKNVAGPPVYYPPGHEMFAKKEESAAAWSAQGGYARASGKYQYEAESKSKSKSSSGAAVVPVCLPLCCAMPCVIM